MLQTSLSLDYIVKPSKHQNNAPLLILIHGYGSNEADLFAFASELSDDFLTISVRAPYKLQPTGNAWYAINFDADKGKWSDNEQAKSSVALIAKFIDEVTALYKTDTKQTTLLGFSQGCILSYAVALSFPEKVKNIIGLSGYINKDILQEDIANKDFSHLDFYCSHGNLDQVIPPEWARQTKPFLDNLNISNSYAEFAVGHGVAPENFFEFKKWLDHKL